MKLLEISGVKCYCFSSDFDVFKIFDYLISNSLGTYSVAINAEKIIRCHEDPDFLKIVNESFFQVPDGFAAILFLKKKFGLKSLKIDLPRMALQYSNLKRLRLAIVGTNEENNKLAYNFIEKSFSEINLVGRLNGYNDFQAIVDFLGINQPQIILLGLGSPKQEIISSKLLGIFPNLIIINCGGALDILSGSVKRAPVFFQKFNLEWLYRLLSQPKRFKRQVKLFKIIPIYLFNV
ncbi:lipopolysaccharide N-acetylmannosaminouronosyltransferase [Algoriphagus sp. oki45]|uniref:WecB/TagA/CpsF family glycosyltransferase n=1 Tax=Algoriphagus sp. oki45 TaxID=3067294 RepID=UPI0027F53B8C|nr:lipopolysaccharide N-acetylmannosaminouronosyltransferase [Algoriphagus sp. oki45]